MSVVGRVALASPLARRAHTARASSRARVAAPVSRSTLSPSFGPSKQQRIVQSSVPRRRASTTPTRAMPVVPALVDVLASHWALPALWASCAPAVALAYINPIYAFSVGYGLAVAFATAFVTAAHVASGAYTSTALAWHLAGGAAYGARLAVFLFVRSVTWAEWRERAKKAPEAKATGFFKQTVVIALCSALYAMMTSPMLWHAQNANAVNAAKYGVVVVGGLVTQWLGVILEAAADQQKYNFKATERGKTRWCDEGLYKWCRHPNYLGELLFWIGTYVAGAPAMLTRPVTFVPATLGLAFIVKLMLMAAKRGDAKQSEKYADNVEYKAWYDATCSLVPGN
jgi:steroid 5-alpha reductase family enzyme